MEERPCLYFRKCTSEPQFFWQVLTLSDGLEELGRITFCPECGAFIKEYWYEIAKESNEGHHEED